MIKLKDESNIFRRSIIFLRIIGAKGCATSMVNYGIFARVLFKFNRIIFLYLRQM